MGNFDRKNHWENIYNTKELKDVSWFQVRPETSLDFFKQFNVPTTAKIIDIGGGDSLLVDHLLDLGYQDISVLDISESAIERAKIRLGQKANNEISNYLETAQKSINPKGILVIGTFSEQGPKKCSGIEIKQYSETSMTDRLKIFFEKIKCITVDHITPFDTIQNFVFCSFKKLNTA